MSLALNSQIATLFDDLDPQIPDRAGSPATGATDDAPAGPAGAVRTTGGTSLLPAGGNDLDTERLALLLAALAPGSNDVRYLTIPGAPPRKVRPRHSRRGTYRTKEDVAAEIRTGGFIRTIFPEPMTGNVAVGCVFFRPDHQFIDTDNMLKHVCDSANKIAYLDDAQATAVCGFIEYDPVNPRTILVFAHHASSMRRGTDDLLVCARCDNSFVAAGRTVKYCSKACQYPKRTQGGAPC